MIMATVYGRVGKEPEMKATTDGTAVLKFSVASNSVKREGEPTWVRVAVFGGRATTLQPMIHSGDRIACSGRVEQRKWQGNEGTVVDLEMNASDVALVETKADSEARGNATQPAAQPSRAAQPRPANAPAGRKVPF